MPSVEIEIELANGSDSMLATALRDAIAGTLERYPRRIASFRALRDRVLVRAEDTGEAVTLAFDHGKLQISDGEAGAAQIRIIGDRDTILALTRLRLRYGLPDLTSEAGRRIVTQQLGGQLTIRGLLLRLPQIRHLLQVVAGG